MNGIGPELPLNRDHRFGLFSLITNYKDEVRQNFKNLLLTAPGERMMIPDFGVGLRNFLFEPSPHAIPRIRQRISAQVSIFIEFDVPSINLSTSMVLQSEDIN